MSLKTDSNYKDTNRFGEHLICPIIVLTDFAN